MKRDTSRLIAIRKKKSLEKVATSKNVKSGSYMVKKLEIVNSYVYLGFLFTTTLSLNQSVTHLARKGKTASFDVIRVYRRLDPMTKDTF